MDGRWWCLQHVEFEGPALLADALARAGQPLEVCRLDLGHRLPDPAVVAGLVVLGGPMNALDDTHHPHLRAERALLAACVSLQVPVLGICLGAQLLAAALGSAVIRGPEPEIGVGTVELTAAGHDDPVLGGAGCSVPVVHWHEDTVELPPGAELLATSSRYPLQAFRAGPLAYGFQFHVELGPAQHRLLEANMPRQHLPSVEELDPVARAGRPVLDRFVALADHHTAAGAAATTGRPGTP